MGLRKFLFVLLSCATVAQAQNPIGPRVDVVPLGTSAGETGQLRFYELIANGSNYTGFKAPDSMSGDQIYALPAADGNNGDALTTNGAGVLSWVPATGSTGCVPTGASGEVLFSDGAGACNDDSNLFWDDTNKELGIRASPNLPLHVYIGSSGGGITNIARFQYGANVSDGGALIFGNTATADHGRLVFWTPDGSGHTDFRVESRATTVLQFDDNTNDWDIYGPTTINSLGGTAGTLDILSGALSVITASTENVTAELKGRASQTGQLILARFSDNTQVFEVTGESDVTNGAGVVIARHILPQSSGSGVYDVGTSARPFRDANFEEVFGGKLWATDAATNAFTIQGGATPNIEGGSSSGESIMRWYASDTAAKVTINTVNAATDYGEITVLGNIGAFHVGGTQGDIDAQGDIRAGSDGSGVFRGPSGSAGFSGSCGSSTTLTVSGGIITGCT